MQARSYRRNAVYGGVFFIIATAFLFVGEIFYGPPLTGPGLLAKAAEGAAMVHLGVLLEFASVLAIPLIAIALWPVLRLVSPALAMGYVVFRALEAVVFANLQFDRLFVLSLAQGAAGGDAATLEALGEAVIGMTVWTGVTGPIYNLIFVIGMGMLNWIFWTSRLVPRWIAGWGLVTAPVLGVLAVVSVLAEVPGAVAAALIVPLAVQEMVLAAWLIWRGFDGAALGRLGAAPPVGGA